MRLNNLSVCAAAATLSSTAWAGPVTYTFTGHVTSTSFTTGSLAAVSVNDVATWQYTFENTTTGTYNLTGGGTTELYGYSDATFSGSVDIGSVSAASNFGTFTKYNTLSGGNDVYDANLFGTGLVAASHRVFVRLTDGSGTAFDSSSIASLSPDIDFSAFSSRAGIIIELGTSNRLDIVWTGLVIDNPVIPLPTGAAMAFFGLGMIGVRRHRNPME